ncbi:MAG: hypothetical protein Unbinned1322contig1000_50 [Prokaryotic dsDNA virus sp.]|nr:hypothetical protein [Aequorivita sp.]QDP57306.1 MAG: hypothetical protein Unbinned1322contig1000_50 [Prokaryotic dsDNA virus sp.]|tara:strand:- start:29855 stop:30751 length:897 start_codon:yes stop_codon:yes gene_type:complete
MIASNLDTVVDYGAGAPSFAFPFKTFDNEDVEAKVRLISTGAETALVLDTDFSLSGIGNTGGDVTLIDAGQPFVNAGNLAVGYRIYIYFKPNLQQLTKFRDLGRNAPRRIEDAVDRITMHVKGFFEGVGEVARSLKLPSSVHPDEFDPTLPDGFNSAEDNVLAVNAAMNGFKVVQVSASAALDAFLAQAYTPGGIQTLSAGAPVVVGQYERQHVRIKSDTGEKALDIQPFGNNDALLQDGMEIVVESDSDTDYMTLAVNDNDYGYVGNGGIEFKEGTVVSFIYNEPKKRFYVKSLGAW